MVALEGQRATLGNLVVYAMLPGLQAKLAALAGTGDPPPESTQTLRQVSILFWTWWAPRPRPST
jgi:hypothetical protein